MKNANRETIKNAIELELGQKIRIFKEYDGFWMFDAEDGRTYTNKLTKTNKHKSNSIRLW